MLLKVKKDVYHLWVQLELPRPMMNRLSRNLGTLSRGTSKEAFFHAKSGSGLDFSSNLAYDLCEVKKETTVLRVRSPFSMTSRGNSKD